LIVYVLAHLKLGPCLSLGLSHRGIGDAGETRRHKRDAVLRVAGQSSHDPVNILWWIDRIGRGFLNQLSNSCSWGRNFTLRWTVQRSV